MDEITFLRKNKIFLGKTEKKIIDYLFNCYQSPAPGNRPDSFIPHKTILDHLNVHRNSLGSALKSLVKKGIIEKERKIYRNKGRQGGRLHETFYRITIEGKLLADYIMIDNSFPKSYFKRIFDILEYGSIEKNILYT